MAYGTLEERVNSLEASLEQLQRLVQSNLVQTKTREKLGWKAIVGTFADDPHYLEAMRLGREWRESQFDETS